MWEQIERNRRNSVFVVTGLGILLVAIGMAVGMFFTGAEQGAIAGGVIALVLWFFLWTTMRSRGDGPPFHKIGRLVRYSLEDVESYLASVKTRSIAEALARNRAG